MNMVSDMEGARYKAESLRFCLRRQPGAAAPARSRAIAVALFALLLLSSGPQHAATPDAAAPDFTLPSAAGPNVRLQEQRGQVVMINFWATWCGPCQRELPLLDRIYGRYRAAGFVLLGVNIDDDRRKAAELAGRLGLSFPVLFDTDHRISRLYELNTMPSSVLIDRDGRVRKVFLGYQDGFERDYEARVAALLKE
jgi:peroxiredoxin